MDLLLIYQTHILHTPWGLSQLCVFPDVIYIRASTLFSDTMTRTHLWYNYIFCLIELYLGTSEMNLYDTHPSIS